MERSIRLSLHKLCVVRAQYQRRIGVSEVFH